MPGIAQDLLEEAGAHNPGDDLHHEAESEDAQHNGQSRLNQVVGRGDGGKEAVGLDVSAAGTQGAAEGEAGVVSVETVP